MWPRLFLQSENRGLFKLKSIKIRLPDEIVQEMERLAFLIGLQDSEELAVVAVKEKLIKFRCVSSNLIMLEDKCRSKNFNLEEYE